MNLLLETVARSCLVQCVQRFLPEQVPFNDKREVPDPALSPQRIVVADARASIIIVSAAVLRFRSAMRFCRKLSSTATVRS